MCVRNLVGCMLVLTLLLLPGFLGCQTPADYSAMNGKIDDLSKNVRNSSDEMDEAAKGRVTQKDVDAVREKVAAGERELVQVKAELAAAGKEQSSASLNERLAKLEKDLQAMNEAIIEQRSIVGQVATQDNAGGWIPAIGKVAKDPRFTAAVDEVVGKAIDKRTLQALPPWATVRIDNRMSSWQKLEVNDIAYWIPPQGIRDFTVPAGWATTWLVEHEAAKKWWPVAADHFQRVIIDRDPLYNSVVRYP